MRKDNILSRYYGDAYLNQQNQPKDSRPNLSYPNCSLKSPPKQYFPHKYNPSPKISSPKIYDERQLDNHYNAQQRSFLRHTTYAPRSEAFLDDSSFSLGSSNVSEYLHRNRSMAETKDLTSSSAYSTDFDSHSRSQKRFNKYNKINVFTPKAREAPNYYDFSSKSKYNNISNSDIDQPELKEQNGFKASQKKQNEEGFKKKEFKPYFYTPKPQSNEVYDLKKIKRIYSPEAELLKVSSPSYKQSKQFVSIKDFIVDAQIGGGKFGSVHKAIHIKTGSIYALKKISKQVLKQNMLIDQFILECKIQSFLKHENIVQVYGIFDDKENIYMVLEYMANGSLYSLLKKKKKLSENQTALKVKQIVKALLFMHSNGIVHRDIKPENVVIIGNVCKLCDFGWSTICEDRRKTHCGTFDYVAPEIFEGEEYGMSIDFWCVGVITYELLVGKSPFFHISRKDTVSDILNVESKKINYPEQISEKAQSFIQSLLKKNPEQRLCTDKIFAHPFLADAEQQ